MNFLAKRRRCNCKGDIGCKLCTGQTTHQINPSEQRMQDHLFSRHITTRQRELPGNPSPSIREKESIKTRFRDSVTRRADSSSEIPYSRSQSEGCGDPRADNQLQAYTDSLLLDGTSMRSINPETTYWDLEGLKRLLKEHKRPWDSESTDLMAANELTSWARQVQCSADRDIEEPLVIPRPESQPENWSTGFNHDVDLNSQNSPILLFSGSPTTDMIDGNDHGQYPRDSQSWHLPRHSISPIHHDASPQLQHLPTQETERAQKCRSGSETRSITWIPCLSFDEQLGVDGNEEIFFRVLDAAYNAIVGSQEPYGTTIVDKLDAKDDDDIYTGSMVKKEVHRGRGPTPPVIESPAASSFRIFPEDSHYPERNGLVAADSQRDIRKSSLQIPVPYIGYGYSWPWDTGNGLVDRNLGILTTCDQPFGFWRQNKLY